MVLCHLNLTITDRGLVIHPDYPYLGATPDGFVKCSCCGCGVIEINRIKRNDAFLMETIDKATKFFKYGILPELVGKWYTRSPQIMDPSLSQACTSASPGKETDTPETWCYCNTEESGTMIFCDNERCPIKWFHVNCLKITNIPKKKWFCPDCRKEKTTSRKKKSH